nr:reverse transcriptase domain-containing protein [Tanacetum cinerariifolium]
MLLDFDDIKDASDEKIEGSEKGKTKVGDEDLSKLLKEVLKCPFTRRIIGHRFLVNAKIYDGTGDPPDHTLDGKTRAWFDKLQPGSIDNWSSLQEKFLNRFRMLKACDKEQTEISKIVLKANETLPHFKERWVSESNAIPNVPEQMQISSFMSSHKCPELAKRFSDNVPKTVYEMLKRVDDYLRYEEAFRSTELPKGEFQRKNVSLELALESGKLNHLVKDVRQRGRGGQRNNSPQKAKVINMVHCNSLDRKRKTTMTDEKWMNVPIMFPPVLARDLSEEALVVETEVEGYLVRRIHIGEWASIEIMFEHYFNIIHPSIRSRREGKKQAIGPPEEEGTKDDVSLMEQDYYPLLERDSKIEAIIGFPLKCFLDTYKGYHQVQMAEEDAVKNAFYIDQGTYCYTKMPFGLKNAGATYQREDQGHSRNAVTQNVGEMQSLAGKLAVLNSFLSRSAEKSLPFFETLKDITKENKHNYRWTEKAKNAFQELKKMVLDLPDLTTPLPKETLFVYLAESKEAVSVVLLVMALALRHMSRRLRRYFEAHPITVITDQAIKQILNNADTSGRLAQYFVELAAYNITYESCSAIKGQILADFINEVPVDGASSAKGSGAGVVLISLTKTKYTYALRLSFERTNNQAEYEALLAGLRIAKKMGVQVVSVNVDSKLVASQSTETTRLARKI